jgi:hypothetical protein
VSTREFRTPDELTRFLLTQNLGCPPGRIGEIVADVQLTGSWKDDSMRINFTGGLFTIDYLR